jgi:drug/metabolite transporter (DMT)-like permease
MSPRPPQSDNARGILYMLACCIGFITNDMFVKLASEDIPIPQVIVIRSVIALPLVVLYCWHRGIFASLWKLRDRFLWWRTAAELGGTAAYLTALARMDIAVSTAITQTTPLAVTAGAALFFGEKVGWRRWSAIAIGFVAVLIIIRPGTAGFSPWSLLALLTVAFVVVRDLTSRRMAAWIDPIAVAFISLAALIPLGLALSAFEPWQPLTNLALLYCLGAAVALTIAYVLVVSAVRFGEISVVAPFRYSVLLWAILIQIAVFSVWPDSLTLIGSAILVATGLYTVYREHRIKGDHVPLSAGVTATAPPAP